MKQDYPNGEQQKSTQVISRPLDKNSSTVGGTTLHPHSEFKINQKNYHMIDSKNILEIQK